MTLRSLLQKLVRNPAFLKIGPKLTKVDRAVQVITRGRINSLGEKSAPRFQLETTGAKTGQKRTIPLLYVPNGDGYIVVGSNWGQDHHPAWTANLIANPDAVVIRGGRRQQVRAVFGEGALRDELWKTATDFWPPYAGYAEKLGDTRQIRLFRLDPVQAG